MRIITRPLKAPTDPITDFADLHYPLWASDKEDGIRCLICPLRGAISGQMKPIPNKHVRELLNLSIYDYLDGELVALDSEGRDANFNDTQSAIMSIEGIPSFQFRVFDCFENIYASYVERARRAQEKIDVIGLSDVVWLKQTLCRTVLDIKKCEESALRRGKEGIMLRAPCGFYKEARSTLSEGYLLKVKRFTDDECVVYGVEEEQANTNPSILNERGLSQRSKHVVGLKGKGMVGKLLCHWRGLLLSIGSGLTENQKHEWWVYPERIIGQTVTFRYQAHGMKVLPRSPIFKGIRKDG